MGLGIPPLESKIPLESNPLKSRIAVRRLAVSVGGILRPIGNFPEILGQQIVVRIILVGRLGVLFQRLMYIYIYIYNRERENIHIHIH